MRPSLPHDAYEALADAYAAMTDTKPHNAYYERPATQSLVGDVESKVILDLGCGTGAYTEWLLGRGATVVALDANEKMLSHARARNGNRATYHCANIEEPLSFLADGSFDGILSALTVTYVRDQAALFAELRRVLRMGGWFVFSTEHPFFSYGYFKVDNYFETKAVSCTWTGFGQEVLMPSYYHSLGTITEALAGNGFVIERMLEPRPTEEFQAADPAGHQKLVRFPLFICVRARRAA